MKVEELMIGDWVRYRGRNMQIAEIANELKLSIYWDTNMASYNEIEPISITPEILKKNGFEGDDFLSPIGYKEWVSEDSRIVVHNQSNMIFRNWSVHIDNKDFQTIGSADIEYVHELQHMLRLCEIDKEIVL